MHASFRLVAVALIGAAQVAGCGGGGGSSPSGAGIRVSPTTLATIERGASVPFDVSLGTQPTSSVSLILAVSDATEGEVQTPAMITSGTVATLTFTTANWNVPQTVQVVPMDDTDKDGPITYTVAVAVSSTGDAAYSSTPPAQVAVTNADDEVPGFTVTKTAMTLGEAGLSGVFYVRLNVEPPATVSLPVTSSDVTEALLSTTGGKVASATLTFGTANWNVLQPVNVHPVDDPIADGNQTFDVVIGPATGPTPYPSLPAKAVSVTVVDDETAGITIAKAGTPLGTSENGAIATFTVRLNAQPVVDTVVPVTSGNPAEGLLSAAGQNLVPSANLTFTAADWMTPQTVTITGQDDLLSPVFGDNVTYDVTVGPATGDPAHQVLPAQKVGVLNTDNDTAVVTVPAAGGSPLQTRESGVRTATFTVAINRLPSPSLTIPISTSDATEALIEDPADPAVPVPTLGVTFDATDWQTVRTITVVGQPDALADGNQSYAITVGTPTGDAAYAGVAPQDVSAVNVDTDAAGFTIAAGPETQVSATEGAAPGTFTVFLNVKPEANVVVPVTSANVAEGLLAGGDSPGSFVQTIHLTFTPDDWATPQTVQVKAPADHVDDGNKVYAIYVGPTSSTSGPYDGLAQRKVTGWSLDVDWSSVNYSPASGLLTSDAGATATVTVQITSIPATPVTVPISVSDATEVLVSAGGAPAASLNLTFTDANWSVPQTVTIAGQPDGFPDGDRNFTIWVGPCTGNTAFCAGASAMPAYGKNVDTDVGANEGTLSVPLALANGVARESQVGPGGTSYYVVDLAPGAKFGVSLAGASDPVALTVDDDGNFASGNFCTSVAAPAGSGAVCSGTVAAGGKVYVRVATASTSGGSYALYAGTPKLYTSADVPRNIPSGSYGRSDLQIVGGPLMLSKAIVRFDITYPSDGNLLITLASPTGASPTLAAMVGGAGANFTGTIVDPDAATPISAGTAPFTGTFAPSVSMASLTGSPVDGLWQLKVTDVVGGGAGTIDSWSLEVY